MKIRQKIHCIKCDTEQYMIFEKKGKTHTVCPECGENIDLLYFWPDEESSGYWLPIWNLTDVPKMASSAQSDKH